MYNNENLLCENVESAYRIPESQANLPRIPVQPVGYDEAEVLLRYNSISNQLSIDYKFS